MMIPFINHDTTTTYSASVLTLYIVYFLGSRLISQSVVSHNTTTQPSSGLNKEMTLFHFRLTADPQLVSSLFSRIKPHSILFSSQSPWSELTFQLNALLNEWTQNVTCFSYILQQNSDFADTGRWCLVVRSTFQTADIVLFTSALMEARYSDLQKEKRKKKKRTHPSPERKEVMGMFDSCRCRILKKTQTSCNEWGMTHDSRCSVFREKYMYVKTEKPIQTTLKWCDLQ